jgi:hypothetical protein
MLHALRQVMLDRSPPANRYFSDDFSTYAALVDYPGQRQALSDKRQTDAVEADNAELRHYFARLARKSRCFSPCLRALWSPVKRCVFTWNCRQLSIPASPRYPLIALTLYTPEPCHSPKVSASGLETRSLTR